MRFVLLLLLITQEAFSLANQDMYIRKVDAQAMVCPFDYSKFMVATECFPNYSDCIPVRLGPCSLMRVSEPATGTFRYDYAGTDYDQWVASGGIDPNYPAYIITPLNQLSATVGQVLAIGSGNKPTWETISSSGNPPGTIIDFGGTTCPTGYLLANGAAVDRTTYATLFTAIGTTWGTGNGSTTFNLPNLSNRYARGSGTSAVGILQAQMTARPATNFTTNTTGDHAHTANGTTATNGAHTHTYNGYNNVGAGSTQVKSRDIIALDAPDYGGNSAGDHNHTFSITTNTTGNHSHSVTGGGDSETRPVSYVVLKCIKN